METLRPAPVRDDVTTALGRVLVVDGGPPDASFSAGLRASRDLLDGLVALGGEVSLFTMGPTNSDDSPLLRELRARGIARIHRREDVGLGDLLAQQPVDLLVANRPGPASMALGTLAAHPAMASVYWGHDIHARRFTAQASVAKSSIGHQGKVLELAERTCWGAFDGTVYPTEREAGIVRDVTLPEKGMASPYYWLTEDDLTPGTNSDTRAGLLMVGAPDHAPNRDALEWTIAEILPHLINNDPRVRITVVGDWPRAAVASLSGEHVRFTGVVSDAHLRQLHHESMCLFAPLRFGSGSRRKIVAAMGLGLPVVTTSEGQEGVLVRDGRGVEDGLWIADTPVDLAAAVDELRRNPGRAAERARAAHRAAAATYCGAAFTRGLARAIARARDNRDNRLKALP